MFTRIVSVYTFICYEKYNNAIIHILVSPFYLHYKSCFINDKLGMSIQNKAKIIFSSVGLIAIFKYSWYKWASRHPHSIF